MFVVIKIESWFWMSNGSGDGTEDAKVVDQAEEERATKEKALVLKEKDPDISTSEEHSEEEERHSRYEVSPLKGLVLYKVNQAPFLFRTRGEISTRPHY